MKTFKEIDIKYYDNSGNVQVRCTVPVTQEALVHYELMQSHYCKLSFKLSRPTYFLLGDFIETPYGRFELIDLTKAKDNDTIGYSYEIQFDAYYRKLKNKILKYRPNTGSQEATFSLTSKISTHIEVIMKNLAYYAKLDKSYLYDPNFEGEGTDYTYVIDASVDANAAKLITYSNSSILDAIANIAQTFGCEWWFEGNILHFGTCENTNAITDFRLNDNIVSMSSSQSQSTYANRVYAFGAARNLPSGYKNDSDADITKDGVVEKRLMLPTSAECSEQNKQMLAENGFELKNGYIQVGGLREDQYVEGVTTNDDIYPRNLIKTSKVTSYEKDVEDESTPEEGDYIKRTFYRVNSLTIVNEDGEKTGDMAFRKAYILSGKNLHIVFQSGSLNGMDFECEFNPDGVPEILLDDDGNPIFKDGKEQINPKSQVFEIVANEDYGRFLPDTTLHPKDGDTFVLYNWNSTKLGDALVPSASNELLADAIKNLKKSVIDPTTYTCTAEDNYSYNHGRGNLHGVGDRVNLYNKGYGDGYRSSRVIGYEFSLDIPFDGAKYYVGEKPSYSRLNAMESKIEELIYNGQSYLNGNGGSGRSIYIIKSYDSITPTDYNVFSAKAVDEQRLNKTKDDTAKGTITWEKVQKLLSGLLVGNSNFENGGSWTPDTEGRSHLITDYLEVRMKAIFEELVVKKTSTIGGKEIISPAGGVVAHKVEDVTVTYNNVSQKAYRCYFLAEQEGDAVDNDFSVNDQVRSESFNVRKGTYHKVGNHFYWRLVIGRDEDPVELEGKKYHYIDLSDTDCATASDVPAKGDVLNQCGNRTDVDRQNCLIFSAVDTYSPSIGLYHGINSYSFANREYVEYGVNKQTNKAFFNVYGDMYVGDRPTKENNYEGSSYIKYDSAAKQVSIKGKLSAKSTVDGKELSQYIKENSAGGLTEEQVNNLIKNSQVIADLQNQVDGAIETWFYEGVPTLKNAPASSWTTDKDKDTHLGDLYYDNKTGKAYRFAKDGSTYKWAIITDTDIAKALSDASKAQETADGKMKVFSTQPIPPYQLGDIWVNATYPTDGSIYKNEILRCQTAKAKGSSFAIADWTKASKYTDDSALNTFKEEYKNDMASYKEQLDEKVETWFYNYAPTTQNKPASDWTTDTLKSQHAGDLFYNTSNGYTYRWTGTAWERIKDNDINTAMTAASKAQDTADGKRTVFTSQPTVPYDEGDLWASGGDDGKTLMVCVKSRTTGSFTSSEWVKANDSDLNAFAKTIEESLKGIRDQLDKKAETWYQATDPSTSWTTDDAKKEHKGDLWYNTSNNQTFFWNGTKWDKQDVPTEVFDKIDGKSSIYVSKPASYEERDLWILEAAYTLGDVAYSKGELVVATKTNASFSADDWTKKVKYTDDTVANAAKKAAEDAQKAANTAQTNITNLGKTVTTNKKAFDSYVTDGYLEPSEIAAMAQDSKRLEDAFAAAEKSYTEVKGAEVLKSTKELTNLNTAFATLTTAKTELVTYLSDISARYNAANTEGKATIVSAVGTKFTNFQSAYSAFYDKLGLANAYITSKIYGDLKQNITDLAGYKYIKDALGQTTDIDGGLVMTTLLALRDADGNVQSGINGAIDPNRGKKSIATWWGGQMVDKDYNSGSLTPATSIVRFDGSGYLANGAIWWDVDGKVHADPTSFIISEKNLGAYLTFFEPTWKAGSAGTSVADLVSLKPNAPFTKLGVSGDAAFEGAISFHGIKLTYDATNKAIKIDGNLYVTGGITAYGAGTSTSTGGGLNGSVKSYADALKLASESLSEIASAYSIKQLSTRITSLEGGSATSISVSGSGNAVTSVTKNGTTISVVKGATFLTSHQSLSAYLKSADAEKTYSKLGHTHAFSEITGKPTTLAGYGVTDGVNAVSVTGNGNAVTSASIDGHTLTLTKGSTFSLSGHTHTFASLTSKPTTIAGYGITDAYTKAQVDSTIAKYLPLAGGTITGALTVNGIATFKSKVAIGDIYIINDGSGNLYVQKTDGKTAANFYATGGITAFGASSVSGGTGSGLNGSVLGFEKATAMTSADNGDSSKTEVSFLATAWSIKQLNDKINAFGTGVFSDYLTIAAAKATYQPKGSYLTSHQTIYGLTIQKNGTSLGTYTPNSAAKTINVTVPTKLSELSNDSGYTKNTGTVTSVAISVPTGLSVSGSPITTNGTIAIALASGYSIPTTAKQTAWDGAVSAKHTHSNKSVLDGISSTKVSHWNSAYDWYALMTTDEETADGIINKWNEVVSFLANIAQTDTLSGIVDGINKSISDEVARAKKAEGVNASGISANKGSIATLQGYFTNGSAKKALQLTNARKLWGNSFNGTADINGSIIVPNGKYISIGNIKLEYDAANKALKITNTTTNEVANLYTSGGVSAYGVGTSSSSGGGLNGSVKSYSDALKLTSESLSEIASAYSIKQLSTRITSLEGGSATSISVSGSGNAVTSITKNGTTITVTKGATFLTAHQSLSAYMKTADAKSLFLYHTRENIVTDLDNFNTSGASHIYEMKDVTNTPTDNGWLQVMNWGSADANYGMLLANDYSINGSLYFRHKVAGKWNAWKTLIDSSNIANQSVKYATTAGTAKNPNALSWSGYASGSYDGSVAKSISIPNNTNQLTNGAGFITASASITGNAATATKLATARNIALGHDFRGSANFDGTGNITINGHINAAIISLGSTDPSPFKRIAHVQVSGSYNDNALLLYLSQGYIGGYFGICRVEFRTNDVSEAGSAVASVKWLFRYGYATDYVQVGFYSAKHNSYMDVFVKTTGGYQGTVIRCLQDSRGSINSNVSLLKATATTEAYTSIEAAATALYKLAYTAIVKGSDVGAVNYANSAGNAGTLDGIHANGLFTNLSNNGNNLSITIGGTNKTLTVGYATKAAQLNTARKLWGNSFNGTADINGSIIVPNGKYISIGNIKLEYDAANKALKITNTTTNEVANLYTSGGVSAYGVGTSSSSGGGLNGSVKSYSDALKLTSESLSEIASAYSIKQLSTRITSLEGGSATSISVSGSGNAVTSITKNGTTITVTKGATFLTAHQSLSAYMKTADAKSLFLYHTRENIVTDLDNFNTSGASHIYEMKDVTNTPTDNGWLQVMNWGSADANYGMLLANDYSINGSLYFRHKVAGKWNAWKTLIDSSNIANQSVKYATTAGTAKNPNALSWSGYASGSYDGSVAKSISIPNNTNQLTNGAGFITASASITGNAATATKLATARNIALGHDFRGSANFDGTGNITINGHINAAIISLGSTDPSPFKRIAHVQVSGSYNDNALLLYLSQGYIGGYFGICRVEFRTNDVSEAGSAVASVKWLFRYGYATDYVQVGFYSAKHNSYMDVFVKTTGGYQGTVIRCLQDSRGSINSNVSLLKATATTEAYTSIEAAATALYKLAYTAIVKGSDVGAVNYANSAGNAGTLDGIHANGLFTNLSNNGNNLSITIGGTNKTLTVGYATKAAQLNTARTLWGQSFDGTGNVNGTLTNTNSAGSETIIRCSNTNGQIDLLTSVNRGVYDRTKTRWLIGTNGANSWLDCGNVGIGTNAPAYKLDVSGDARATNFRGALVGNAATATKLQTARTIWGQSFNGTANVSGSITGVNNITMSNNSYLYGKNTGGTAIQLIAMASWNSVDIGRGALTYGYTTQVMGKTVALTASDDSGKNTKSVELSTAKLYSNVNIETEGGLLAHGGVTAYSSSDIRLKQDLRKLDYLGIIKAMGGTFSFAWKKDNTRSIGWIAQHVLCNPHLKDIVETDEKGYYKINYWSPKLIATAFGAIEQVGDEVSRLKTRVVFLESEVQRLSGKQDGNNKKRLDNKNINLLN